RSIGCTRSPRPDRSWTWSPVSAACALRHAPYEAWREIRDQKGKAVMIVGTAWCPHPPLLLRALTGEQDPAAPVRQACRKALAALMELVPETSVVTGGANTTGTHRGTTVPDRALGGPGTPTDRLGALH